jgi:cell division protease FtsH
VHARNKKLMKGVNLHEISKQTVGLTGADLENIMNEAAIIAAKRKAKTVAHADIVEAVEKVTIGAAKRSRKLTQKEKEITAYHELGHAIVGHLCPESDPLHKISVVSRGSTLGVTWFLPQEDTFTTSRGKFLDEICGLLGGRAAEELVFNERTTGASNDLEKASQIARDMAMRYGMGGDDLGAVTYGEKQGTIFLGVDPSLTRNYSEEKARQIDAFVKETIEKQYERALGMLKQHRDKLDILAKILLKQETMSIGEFEEIFSGKKSNGEKRKGKREIGTNV